MRTWIWSSTVWLAVGATVGGLLSACSSKSSGDDKFTADSAPSLETGGDASLDETGPSDDGLKFDATAKKPTGLELDPPTASVEVRNGDLSKGVVVFSPRLVYDDGSKAPFTGCTWTLDNGGLGTVKGGSFEPTGTAGGQGNVRCEGGGFVATAKVNVKLVDTVDDPALGLDEATRADLLSTTTPDPKIDKLLYPYDNTVFPRGLEAPELMWSGGGAADVYAISFEETGMAVTVFSKSPTPSRYQLPRATWNKILDSNGGEPLTVTVRRLAGGPGGTAFLTTKQSWSLAAANLRGSIYFWSIVKGSVLKIRPGASKPESFLKTSGTAGRCVACHSVSHDGSTIVAAYDGGASPWVTFDAATGGERYSSGSASGFQAVSPDGKLTVHGQSGGGALSLSETGGKSLEPSGLAGMGAGVHPAFSPSGKLLSMGVRKDGNWLDFNVSDLVIVDFDPDTKKFSGKRTLREGVGRAYTYPSFSPDNAWVAYMDGAASRTRNSKGDLRLIRPDGTGDVSLEKACKYGIPDIDKSLNYEPTFSPFVAGGYYWLVFVSSRQYGNRLNTTNEAGCSGDYKMCRRKQLWVTAVDIDGKPLEDPSHPPFWLPGQDLDDQNMRGYWALDACRKLGEGCEAGFECCEGSCRLGDEGKKICVKPPPDSCKATDDKCEKTSDCCDAPRGIECIGNICASKRPK